MSCSVCGHPLPDDARFCPNCGAPVGTVASSIGTEERKMVTVLFADLVDSTGLAQRLDVERAREILGRFFDAANEELEALRGRAEKFIGDAVMAVFGLPRVHEDDAIRAVRAGLAIRERASRLGHSLGLAEPLEVRVGIATGEAATGVGPAGQLLVTGPVVNTAARLQSAAAPGEVLAGETTQALTETAVSYGASRSVRAKGFSAELPAFPVESLTTRSGRRTIPFVGRGNELTILRENFTRVATTGRPVLVTVVGESGIGKSRLADELIAGLDPGATVLSARGLSYTDTASFAPAAAIVRDMARIDDADPQEKARSKLRELAERWCGADDAERIADRLALLFGMTERRDESAFLHDVQAGFLALIDGRARSDPVVLVFEDAHTLQPPMLDLIERVGARSRSPSGRILILALGRQELLEERPSWGSTALNAALLRLEPLSDEDSIELVRQAGSGRIEELEANEIATRAGGNPYFIIETTGMLVSERGNPPTSRLTLPPTVQAVVSARLDALPANLRDLARRASVFIYSFDPAELAAVDGASAEELRELEDAEIIVPCGSSSTSRWRFRHTTLREVAYGSLPKRERLRLHEGVARSLIESGHPSFAADHLELAAIASLDLYPDDRELPDRAADALLAAGERAGRRMESRAAADLYERALALAGAEQGWGAREARALAGMGEARYWLGEYPKAREALDRAVALGTKADDSLSLALSLRFLGDIAINVDGDVDKAEGLLDRSLVAAEAVGDPRASARTLLFAGWVPWTRRRFDDAEGIWRRALSLAEESDDGWARVRALTSLSINRVDVKDFDEALGLIEKASGLAEESGDQFSVAVTTVQTGRVFEELGRFDESLSCFDRGISIFEELGARWELADAIAERGVAKRELGRLDDAEEDLRHAIRLSEELGERQLASWTWRALAGVAKGRGDEAEVEERLLRARQAEARGPR